MDVVHDILSVVVAGESIAQGRGESGEDDGGQKQTDSSDFGETLAKADATSGRRVRASRYATQSGPCPSGSECFDVTRWHGLLTIAAWIRPGGVILVVSFHNVRQFSMWNRNFVNFFIYR